MTFDLSAFHDRNRSGIIQEWLRSLKYEVGDRYTQRPLEELLGTISEAFEANHHVLVNNDFGPIDRFIDKITRMRLKAGFLLSDVQKAFELYRTIVIPLLAREMDSGELCEQLIKINACLAYTIHRFSNHFQDMHEKEILRHNRMLEKEVQLRTAELKESELKYKTLVEEINDGYFVIQDRVVVFANQAFCRMHGYDVDDVIGRNFGLFISPESAEKVLQIYDRRLEAPIDSHAFEYMRLTKNRKSFPTEILTKTATYGNRLSYIGICRDITERVRMEQRVREAERMAYIGQITTSLSHEIRNPLSAVTMNLQILKKNPKLKGNDQRRIDISVREVLRLERILKELLNFAKPPKLRFSPCQVNEVILNCIELLEMRFREENISVETTLEPKMPVMDLDGEKLGQAFINLLLNAIEASESGERIRVRSRHKRNGKKRVAEIIVEDRGKGVAKEHVDNIFKPFFTTKSKGTGLGLSNVKRIVEGHGGQVRLENRYPKGACFQIILETEKENGTDFGCRR